MPPTSPELLKESSQADEVKEVNDLRLPEHDTGEAGEDEENADVQHVFDDDLEMQPGADEANGDGTDLTRDAGADSSKKNLREESLNRPRGEACATPDESDAEPSQSDDDLFAKLAAAPSSVPGLVTEWLASVQLNGPSAVADVLSLVVRLARPVASPPLDAVTPQMVIANDPPATVREIGHLLRADVSGPLPASGKDPVCRKLRRAYEDFWRRLTAESSKIVLFDTDCFDTLISWLDAMTIARSRGLRIAACLAAFRLVDGFIEFGGRLRKELSSMQRQLATEKRKCGLVTDQARMKGRSKRASTGNPSKALSQKGKDLARKVDELTANNSELVELSSKVFDSILVLKYRDVAAEIRTIAVTALGAWIMAYPDHFLDDKHTKYIGWLLSDKESAVRRATLDVLSRMVQKRAFYSSLEMFLQRFCDRIVEMSRDKDDTVAVTAIRLLTTLSEYELLDDNNRKAICDIALREPQVDVRRAAGEFLSRMIWSESGEEEETGQDISRTKRRKPAAKKRKHPSKDVKNPDLLEVPSPSHSEGSIRGLLFAITRGSGSNQNVEQVVDAVWDHLPALRCWKAFAAIFAAERNFDEVRISSSLNASAKESSLSECAKALSSSDLAIMCEMLVASIREASGLGDSHRAAVVRRGEWDSIDTPRGKFTSVFLPELPQLLVQFQTDARASCALAQIPVYFDMDIIEQDGQETSFKAIMSKLVDLMSRHTGSPLLMKSCAETLKVLCSDENPARSTALATMQRSCSAASKELALHVRTGLSSAESASVVASALRVRIMSELTEPNASVSSSVRSLLQYQFEEGSSSNLPEEATADAARTGCAVIAWCLAKIRARLEPLEGPHDFDTSHVQDAIQDTHERGSGTIALLGKLCSSSSFSMSTRMLCLQGLLTTLTLCNGVEKFSQVKGYSGLRGETHISDHNARDFLGIRVALSGLVGAVGSCVLAIVENLLETTDGGHTGEIRKVRAPEKELSDAKVRDCFASLVQASFQSALSAEVAHLPLLGLLVRHRKPHSIDFTSSEWTTVQLCRRYCQQSRVAPGVRVQQEVRALQDVAGMRSEKGSHLVRHLAEEILSVKEPGEGTRLGARELLEGLMQNCADADESDDQKKAIHVLAEAGLAAVGRLTVDEATPLRSKLRSLTSAADWECLLEDAGAKSAFTTFCKCLESVAADEVPDIPRIPKRWGKESIRGKKTKRRRRRVSIDSRQYQSSSPVEASNLRRSRRGLKRIDYARLSGLSDDAELTDDEAIEGSGSDDDESQMSTEQDRADSEVAACDDSGNLMSFTHSPRIPVKVSDTTAKEIPAITQRARKSSNEDGPVESSGTPVEGTRGIAARSVREEGLELAKEGKNCVSPLNDEITSPVAPETLPPQNGLAGGHIRKHGTGEHASTRYRENSQEKTFGVFEDETRPYPKSNLDESNRKVNTSHRSVPNLPVSPFKPGNGAENSFGASARAQKGQGRDGSARQPRAVQNQESGGATHTSSGRFRLSPADANRSELKKAEVDKDNSCVQDSKTIGTKRGRHRGEMAKGKENIEGSPESAAPGKHSFPSQPVVRRSKRRKRW